MKAWSLAGPASVDERPLVLAERPTPIAREDELLVRVSACGICRTDLHVVEGELPVQLSSVIPGHQIVGRVAAIGSHVEDFAMNDRVGVAWLNRMVEQGREHKILASAQQTPAQSVTCLCVWEMPPGVPTLWLSRRNQPSECSMSRRPST